MFDWIHIHTAPGLRATCARESLVLAQTVSLVRFAAVCFYLILFFFCSSCPEKQTARGLYYAHFCSIFPVVLFSFLARRL